MANQEHLDILRQGAQAWNNWRKVEPDVLPDLTGADLSKSHLMGYDFTGADLSGTNLSNCSFSGSKFASIGRVFKGNLVALKVDLVGANLTRASLADIDLSQADLTEANLEEANLSNASLFGAKLNKANLNNTFLYYTNFNEAELNETSFYNARMVKTIFGDVDLSKAKGLTAVQHEAPLIIGIETIYRSEGLIPEVFLRGAGVPDSFLEIAASIVKRPIEFYTCFISYSSKDQEFVERLYADLQSKGVRCWFAPEDIKIGDRIRDRIDQSIRLHDKLLLVLSKNSVSSSWVEFEVEAAIAKENKSNALMLFPIRIDNAIKESRTSWAAHIRRTRNIGDFTNWKQYDSYQKAFSRLMRDLIAETPVSEGQ